MTMQYSTIIKVSESCFQVCINEIPNESNRDIRARATRALRKINWGADEFEFSEDARIFHLPLVEEV